MNRVTFGTYKLKGEKCQISLHMIVDFINKMGLTANIDTAQLYFNEAVVGQVLAEINKSNAGATANMKITTKLNKHSSIKKIRDSIDNSFKYLNHIDTFLLHNPMNIVNWVFLEDLFNAGRVKTIGVSNYAIPDLENLLAKCSVKPMINQIEFHPFMNMPKLVDFCRANNIKVVGHSILAQGKFFDNPTLKQIAEAKSKTVAQVMIKWALQKDIDICLSTTSYNHLIEIADAVSDTTASSDTWALSASEMTSIDNIHRETEYSFYLKETKELKLAEAPYIAEMLLKDIEAMKNNNEISNTCMTLPKSYRASQESLEALDAIAKTLFDDKRPKIIEDNLIFSEAKNLRSANSNRSRYDNQLRLLCKYYEQQTLTARQTKWQNKTCCLLKNNISSKIVNPEPMPVTVAETEKITHFIDWLSSNQVITAPQMFTLGTMYPDGRMDMCKQVVGPTHIGKLCQAVAKNQQVKHFLLGNNIACDGSFVAGAEAMATLMKSSSEIKTWYLAGNCIDADCVKVLCDGLKTNITCEALWLKRNPIGPIGAGYLGELFNYNRSIVLLDLHNCGLLDEGLINFCYNLRCDSKDLSLKHLYLDANGLTNNPESVKIFCAFLKRYKNNLESLFLSINKFGDLPIIQICQALSGTPVLKRLILSSNGLSDAAMPAMIEFMLKCSNLVVLGLGYYKSTAELGESQNKITDKSLPELKRLITEHPSLMSVNLGKNRISVAGLKQLTEVDSKVSLCMSEFNSDGETTVNVFRHDKDYLRELKHTPLVYNIDSVYRNNM